MEGTYASVIGGAPAAAVVFAGEVEARAKKDARVQALTQAMAKAEGAEKGRLRAQWDELFKVVHSEKLGEMAAEFDRVHSVQRALDVGALNYIIPPANLRPYLIDAVERGIAERRNRIREVESPSKCVSHSGLGPAEVVFDECLLAGTEPRRRAARNNWLSANEAGCLNARRFAEGAPTGRSGDAGRRNARSPLPWTCLLSPKSSKDGDTRAAQVRPRRFSTKTRSCHYFTQPPGRIELFVRWHLGVELGCDLELVEPRGEAFVCRLFHCRGAGAGFAGDRCRPASACGPALERKGEHAQGAARRLRLDTRT